MNKTLFIIKQIVRGLVSQHIRFVLTSAGILLGVFLFSMGYIICNSWYRTQLEEAEMVPEKTILLTGSNSRLDGVHLLQNIEGANCCIFQKENDERVLIRAQLSEDKVLTVRSSLIGVENEISVGISRSIHLTGSYPADYQTVKGRVILNSEIQKGAKVAVIDEFTERLLFEDHNALGKTITLSSDSRLLGQSEPQQLLSVKIVGVIKDNYYAKEQPYNLKSQFQSNEQQISTQVRIYVPETLLDTENCETIYLFSFENEKAYRSAINLIQNINLQYRYYGEYLIHSKESLISYMRILSVPIQRTIIIIMALVLTLSSFSIMSILFFSTKERFTEIGIRKVLGASRGDIALQFSLEAGVQGVGCSVIAFWLAYFLSTGMQKYIQNQFAIYYHVRLQLSYFLITLLTGMFLSVFSSLLPTIYASSIRVIDVMRME